MRTDLVTLAFLPLYRQRTKTPIVNNDIIASKIQRWLTSDPSDENEVLRKHFGRADGFRFIREVVKAWRGQRSTEFGNQQELAEALLLLLASLRKEGVIR